MSVPSKGTLRGSCSLRSIDRESHRRGRSGNDQHQVVGAMAGECLGSCRVAAHSGICLGDSTSLTGRLAGSTVST